MIREPTAEDDAFREELSAWLDDNLEAAADPEEWHRRLVEGRWAVPAWPARYGGRDCTTAQEIIYNREMAARDAPLPLNTIALYNVGPLLLSSGTPEQQDRYLPKMVSAEEIWCQGFSEPNAGSDLAALSTRADDGGDHWVLNGQKTWNTFGAEADFCLALVRTDPGAEKKHRGITAVIVDMRADGVEVRPLREITGDDGFNEIFLTDVRVPKSHLVGEVHGGWKVAMDTLRHERLGTMKLGVQLRKRLDGVIDLARSLGRDSDPLIRQRVAEVGIQVELMGLLTERALGAIAAGEDPGPTLPLGKLQWSYLMQHLAELAVHMAGPRAQLYRGSRHGMPGDWPYHCLYSRMTTIGAGTTEIQKNIIAYRMLGLPREADTPSRPASPRDRKLPESRAILRDSVRRFLAESCSVDFVRGMYDDERGTTDSVWSELIELGLVGILVPEELGGLGLGLEDAGVVLEEMGRAVSPGPYLSSAVGAVSALRAMGDDEVARGLLREVGAGEKTGALALLEAGASSHDLASVATIAEPDGDVWRLTGTKIAPDGAAADLLLVTARAADAIGLFAVDATNATVTALPTVDGSRKQAEVALARASAQRLGTGDVQGRLRDTGDRVAVAMVIDAIGAADRVLELATEYAKVRRQFDRPIGSFQAVQHLLANMLCNLELARSGAYEALRLADGDDVAAFHRAAVAAKAYASDALYRVGADAIQVFGGIGFSWEHDAHLFYKRIQSMQQAWGSADDHRREYARLLLGS